MPKKKKYKFPKGFKPTDPDNESLTLAQLKTWEDGLEDRSQKTKMETRRYRFATILAAIAAVASVVGILLQLVSMKGC